MPKSLTVSEDELASGFGTDGRLDGLLEPNMILAAVVWYDVNNHLDPLLLELGGHLVEIGQGSDTRVDISVIGHIVWVLAGFQVWDDSCVRFLAPYWLIPSEAEPGKGIIECKER